MEQAEMSQRSVIGAILVVSGLAVSFLMWLLYMHHASADFAGRWMFLPTLNALLNGSCAIALCVGLYFIKHHHKDAHRTSMLLAFAFSFVFLVSYIVNHALHGDTIFPGHGPVRTLYLSILASHVILSIVALPMVLTTFFFSLTGRFAMHRRIARWTFPVWLYVSITGVVVFVFLKVYAY
jgi:putative membrane protein